MSEYTVEGASSSSASATDADAQNLREFIRSAAQALQDPHVIELVKDLGRRGFGICIPHEHPPAGGFLPLASHRIQYEQEQRVSFVDAGDPRLNTAVAVGWRWEDDGLRVTAACHVPHY